MFKDRSQKVWEFVQSTAETEEAGELEVAEEETAASKKKTEKPKKKVTKKVPAAAKPKKISTDSKKILDTLKTLDIEQLKRIAAENGLDTTGTLKQLLVRLEKYLELHGQFKRDLPNSVDATVKTVKVKKDEDKPKRAISAYLFYASERRPILKKECPEMGFGELTLQIASEWRMMKEKDRKKYNTLAAADKKRYDDEQEQWMSKIDQ